MKTRTALFNSLTICCRLKAAFRRHPERRIYAAEVLLTAALALFTNSAPAGQASIVLLNYHADMCQTLNTAWSIANTADTSGLVNGSGPIVWTVNAVKGPASTSTLTVNGFITLSNAGTGPAPLGNVVINLQKPNNHKIGDKLVPWVSAAADIADATQGDAATSANIVAAGSQESPAFNTAYGAHNYTVSGAQEGTFIQTAGSGSLTFATANNTPFALVPPVSLAPGATLTLFYRASFDKTLLGLAAGTSLRVEALVSFANAGARGGSGASAANIDINGNGVIDSNEGPIANVRTVPCRVAASLPAATIGNDSVTLSDTASDLVATGGNVSFTGFATTIGGGSGTEVINASVTRTVSAQATCSGSGSGTLADTAHLRAASSPCTAGLALDAASSVPIACSAGPFQDGDFCTYNQAAWGDTPSGQNIAQVLAANFGTVYPGGFVEVGFERNDPNSPFHTMRFTSSSAVDNYLPAAGAPGGLAADLVDPTTSVSGTLGGNVLALQLNADFSAAGLAGGTGGPFGDLVLHGFTTADSFAGAGLTAEQVSGLNGLTITWCLAMANRLLAGGTPASYELTVPQLDEFVGLLNNSFQGCHPSAFAQAHLRRAAFKPGEFVTFAQETWDSSAGRAALYGNYDVIYASNFGIVEIGILGPGGFSMQFSSAQAVIDYVPASGPLGTLAADLSDPTISPSGPFGGAVLALQLDVDFNAAGVLGSVVGGYSALKLCDFTTDLGLTQAQADAVNGQTVAQLLAEANTVLGGGTGAYGLSLAELEWLVDNVSRGFGDTFITQFAYAHLTRP